MISVTGYDKNGEARVYGRDATDPVAAEDNAKRYAALFLHHHPDAGAIEHWTFRRDTVDRQLFQPSR